MKHLPVLFIEALEALSIKKDGCYLDCTFGRGGHSAGILQQLGAEGRLLAFDRDADAVNSAKAMELQLDVRFKLCHNSFADLAAVSKAEGCFAQVDGILIDLGVSSPQLDSPERGFSFMQDGPLDMRMDIRSGVSAQQWLATVAEDYLVKVLFDYGEERFARRIAKAIVSYRQTHEISTTAQLAKLIADAVPVKDKFKHPATRSFQAIRIEINQELEQLKSVLQQALTVLRPGGRLVIISFHSLEDRIVKRFIRDESGFKHNPGRLPVKEADREKGVLKKVGKAVKAKAEEVAENPRARSAVMRVAEKV